MLPSAPVTTPGLQRLQAPLRTGEASIQGVEVKVWSPRTPGTKLSLFQGCLLLNFHLPLLPQVGECQEVGGRLGILDDSPHRKEMLTKSGPKLSLK